MNKNVLVTINGALGLTNWVEGVNAGVFMMEGDNKGSIVTVTIDRLKEVDATARVKEVVASMTTEQLEAELKRMRAERSSKPATKSQHTTRTTAKKDKVPVAPKDVKLVNEF
jgi:hypothetical protein